MHEPRELLPNPLTQPEQERAMRRLRERTLAGALRVTLSSRYPRLRLVILGVLYVLVPAPVIVLGIYTRGTLQELSFGLVVLYLLKLTGVLLVAILVETVARRARAALTHSD